MALAWTALVVFGGAAYFALTLLATVVYQERAERRAGFADLRGEMRELRSELHSETRGLRDELRALRTEPRGDIRALSDRLTATGA